MNLLGILSGLSGSGSSNTCANNEISINNVHLKMHRYSMHRSSLCSRTDLGLLVVIISNWPELFTISWLVQNLVAWGVSSDNGFLYKHWLITRWHKSHTELGFGVLWSFEGTWEGREGYKAMGWT